VYYMGRTTASEEVKMLEGVVKSKAFDLLSEAASTLVNPEMRKWKDEGGRIVGYFCSAMPVEMITAAGLLPYRVRATGSTGTELSDSYFSSINCSFPRHAFNMALRGEYDFLDGLIIFNSCDHVRRIYDHWTRQLKTPFVQILSLPKKAEDAQVEWFREELRILRGSMQDHFGVEITDGRLREAIALHNRSRRALRRIYDLRKGSAPPVSGAEMLAVTVAGTALPQAVYVRLLDELSRDLAGVEGQTGYRARLMIMGGLLDNPEYVAIIEDQGGLVVTDSVCFGSRTLWTDVDEEASDPLTALARYCVADRPSCARMYAEYPKRLEYVKNMIKEFHVDGVIFQRLAFCETWGFEQYSLTNDFREQGIPLLCMDREYVLGGVGQMKTRVQAFLETLGR
jgi:benzoyl-CoA reductase subunit C